MILYKERDMSLKDQVLQNQNKLKDQTQDTGSYQPPAEGPCIARFVSYIEIGKHQQKAYQGKAKPPAYEVILQFELLGKKHKREVEVEENGETVTKTYYPIVTERLPLKYGDRSNFTKLLQAMDYGRGNNHMALMLGEAFIVKVINNEVQKDGNTRVYTNIRDKSGWHVQAPVRVDEDGETQVIKAPAPTVEERLLLWDVPSAEQWNSLFIPGTSNRKTEEGEIEVPKNWIQELVKSAENYEGSAVQNVVLSEIEGALPEVAPESDTAPAQEASQGSDGETPSEDETPAQTSHSASDDDDPLADLGLD